MLLDFLCLVLLGLLWSFGHHAKIHVDNFGLYISSSYTYILDITYQITKYPNFIPYFIYQNTDLILRCPQYQHTTAKREKTLSHDFGRTSTLRERNNQVDPLVREGLLPLREKKLDP